MKIKRFEYKRANFMADEKKEAEAPQDASPKEPKPIGLFLLAFANLAVMFGGGFLVFKSTIGYERPAIQETELLSQLKEDRELAENAEPVMFTMEPFTVNLDGLPRRMIRVELSLEMLDKEGFEEVVTLGPMARDVVVKILNAKRLSDVETIQGKLFLKDQISVSLNSQLRRGVVKDVYFSDFLVQ